LSLKKKIFAWLGVIGILGIGYNTYHWFDGLTQNRIGYLYYKGVIVYKNDKEAFKWFKRSASKDNPKGITNLGACYLYGHGVSIDHKKAFECFEKAANQNNDMAEFALAQCYQNGRGIVVNDAQAYNYYQKSAQNGNACAQNVIGASFLEGRRISKDVNKAFEWFKKSAEANCEQGQCNLSKLYAAGLGVPKDDEKAFYWAKKAAERGERTSAANLGIFYLQGKGVKRNVKEGIKWIDQGNEDSSADSQRRLGMDYESGSGFVPKDLKKAFNFYSKSAEKGFCCGIYNLGLCYLDGVGTEKNYDKGMELLKKAKGLGCDYASTFLKHERFSPALKIKAESGDVGAQISLGHCYSCGQHGVAVDYKEALRWYTKAAEQGDANGQNSLGYFYQEGKGVTKDEKDAARWYMKSAEQGNVYGQNAVAWVLATSNDPAIRNGKEAVSWAQKSIQKLGEADSNAMDTLAAAYAEQGDFAAAVSTQEKAISTLKDMAKSKEFQAHLKSYQDKKPWRDNE